MNVYETIHNLESAGAQVAAAVPLPSSAPTTGVHWGVPFTVFQNRTTEGENAFTIRIGKGNYVVFLTDYSALGCWEAMVSLLNNDLERFVDDED